MPLTREEFRAALAADLLNPPKLCGCGCGQPLEPNFWGQRHTIGGVEINSDCYFDQLGVELDRQPIGALRVSHSI